MQTDSLHATNACRNFTHSVHPVFELNFTSYMSVAHTHAYHPSCRMGMVGITVRKSSLLLEMYVFWVEAE